jgi:exodeoxyribonuclease VII large subunit
MTPRRDPQLDLEDGAGIYEDTGELFPGGSPSSAIAVTDLTTTAREIVEGAFPPMWVRGEVTDFKAHRSGHWYFSLRDRTSQVRAVIWAREARRLPAPPDEGMQVVAFGRLTVYAARCEMQFAISRLDAEGDGLRQKALEITRKRLAADGLLAPERKRDLPAFPRTIAVITSPDGAALKDIIAVVRKRGMGVRLVVIPAAVQGDTAVPELCRALDRVARWGEAEVVIIGRGGGAREDLWAFNDERVARAVAACPVPTISAVGHETDITICDLVADLRAPTPSAAAEAVTRSRPELVATLRQLHHRLRSGVLTAVGDASTRLDRASRGFARTAGTTVERKRARIESAAGQLHALSPVATLARGYAVSRGLDGRTLSSADDFSAGDAYDLVVRDGVVRSSVVAVNPRAPEQQ